MEENSREKDQDSFRCRRCGGDKVTRSRRKWYEEPLALIGLRPYRCKSCYHRFLMSLHKFTPHPAQSVVRD